MEDGHAAVDSGSDCQKGDRDNNGIRGSHDVVYNNDTSTLVAELADAGYKCRVFEDRDIGDVRCLFVENMGPYTDVWDKRSKFYEFWWAYMRKALDDGDLKSAAELRRVYIEKGGGFWILEDLSTGAAVGTVGFEKLAAPAGAGELRRMNVSKRARRAGLGQKLVRWVEEFAAQNGFNQIVLTTGSVMTPAFRMYEKAGFEHWREGHFPPDVEQEFRMAPHYPGDPDIAKFYEAAFRKPVTSNRGRWIWKAHVVEGPKGAPPNGEMRSNQATTGSVALGNHARDGKDTGGGPQGPALALALLAGLLVGFVLGRNKA